VSRTATALISHTPSLHALIVDFSSILFPAFILPPHITWPLINSIPGGRSTLTVIFSVSLLHKTRHVSSAFSPGRGADDRDKSSLIFHIRAGSDAGREQENNDCVIRINIKAIPRRLKINAPFICSKFLNIKPIGLSDVSQGCANADIR
jgi:hypothetical protein